MGSEMCIRDRNEQIRSGSKNWPIRCRDFNKFEGEKTKFSGFFSKGGGLFLRGGEMVSHGDSTVK